jgi:hypothetical protein
MPDNFIRLIIVTVGEDLDESFNIHQPLRAVKERALNGLPPGTDRNLFVLEYENQPLDEEKKIEEYVTQFGWQDGTVLELRPRPEVI